MKLKKILAAVCAAAIAVTTMAFVPFSASAVGAGIPAAPSFKATVKMVGESFDSDPIDTSDAYNATLDTAGSISTITLPIDKFITSKNNLTTANIMFKTNGDLIVQYIMFSMIALDCGIDVITAVNTDDGAAISNVASHYGFTYDPGENAAKNIMMGAMDILPKMDPDIKVSYKFNVTDAEFIFKDPTHPNNSFYPSKLDGIAESKTITLSMAEMAIQANLLTWTYDISEFVENFLDDTIIAELLYDNGGSSGLTNFQAVYDSLKFKVSFSDFKIGKESTPEPTPEPIVVVEEYIPEVNNAIDDGEKSPVISTSKLNGYETIESALNATANTKDLKIDGSKVNSLTKEFLDTVKNSKKSTTVQVKYNDFKVVIDKKDIKDSVNLIDLSFNKAKNPVTKSIEEMFDSAAMVKGLSFTKSGDFGSVDSVQVLFKIGKNYMNSNVTIYKIVENKLVKLTETLVDAAGYASVDVKDYSSLIFVVN